jgi:hypothetical protein
VSEIPDVRDGADLAVLGDGIARLEDGVLEESLTRLRDALHADALGILRVRDVSDLPPGARFAERIREFSRRRARGRQRTAREVEGLLNRSGYRVADRRLSGGGRWGMLFFFRPDGPRGN